MAVRLRSWLRWMVCLCLLHGCSCDSDDDDDTTLPGDDDSGPADDDDSGSVDDDDDSTPLAWSAGDAATLASTLGNNVGLYSLAACEFSDEVFFTNLHSLGVGVVSTADGTLVDVIDLGDVTDDTVPLFPHVVCLPGTARSRSTTAWPEK